MSSVARPERSLVTALLVLLVAAGAVVVGAGPARAGGAADGFRYWNYSYLEGGRFVAAQVGPADRVPEDGEVEGWRFGTSTVSQGIWPRADLRTVSFDAVCGEEQATAGRKRVAVLVDWGTADEAVDGQRPPNAGYCAVVGEDADGRAILDAVAEVRSSAGLVCGIAGYPTTGCGDPASGVSVPSDEPTVAFDLPGAGETDAPAADEAQQDGGGVGWPVVVGVLALLAAAAVLVPAVRRRRLSPPGPPG